MKIKISHFHRIISLLTACVMTFVTATALAGCDGKENKNVASAPSLIEPTESKKDYNFVFVCPIINNPYWVNCINGIKRADSELGTHTTVIGPDSAEHLEVDMVEYIKQAIDMKPDGILAYSGIEGMTEYIDLASENDISVVTIDSDALTESRVAYVGTDLYNLGFKTGEKMYELTGGNAKVGFICTTESASNEMEVLAAFLDTVRDFDIEIVASCEGFNDKNTAKEATAAMLEEHPEITAIFATGGENITGAAMYSEENDKELTLVGLEDSEANLQYIRDGIIDAIVAQSPESMGYLGVSVLASYLNDGKLSESFYSTETTLITKDNVDTYKNSDKSYQAVMRTVKIGYYDGDTNFQNGFSDDSRKSGYAYEYYQRLSEFAGWKYEYVYGDRSEIMDKLKSGEVDIVAGIYASDIHEGIVFSNDDMGLGTPKRYFAVAEDNYRLLYELNDAIKMLKSEYPGFLPLLYSTYYGQKTQYEVLTDAEREYLADKEQIRFGFMKANLPLCDIDDNGEPIGLVKDVMHYIADYTGVSVCPVVFDDEFEMRDAVQNGEIDLSLRGYSDLWYSEMNGIRQSDTVFSGRTMIVYSGRWSDDKINKIAVSRSCFGQAHFIDEYYPNAEVIYCDSREETLKAVMDGKAGCTVDFSSVLQKFMSDNTDFDSLNISYLSDNIDVVLAVSMDNSLLMSILNKSVRSMGSAAITSSVMSYTSADDEHTLRRFFREYSTPIIVSLIVFVAIISGIFLMYFRQSRLFNRRQRVANAALANALEEAENANKAKTIFLSSMSHDIRTPMNAIIGMVSVARKHRTDDTRVDDCLEKIDMSSRHLLTLINDVLDINQIESGKLTLNPVVFSLRECIEQIMHITVPSAVDKNIDIRVHLKGMMYEKLMADELRINQIFINLISNAVKYTENGGTVTIFVSEAFFDNSDKIRLTFIVEDTGIGMTEDFMKRMYDTFSRADDTRISKINGTGLGLAIVKQMVEMMGGSIDCESTFGEGTKFTVRIDLPYIKPTDEPAIEGLRVLIVDRDDTFAASAAEACLMLSTSVDMASNPRDALRMLKKNEYDVVIADITMTDDNGKSFYGQLREKLATTSCKLLSSSYDLSDEQCEAQKIDMSCHLIKPFFSSYLYERLCAVLDVQAAVTENAVINTNMFAGKHLLVAEDNDLNWEVVSELLEIYGITADRAVNGRVCVDMLSEAKEGTYDMVLMDIQMPQLNGKEATKLIRADDRKYVNSIPIIAMTADAFAHDIAEYISIGMNGHVAKPIDMDELLQEMNKAIAK